jgi:hypothetical protein
MQQGGAVVDRAALGAAGDQAAVFEDSDVGGDCGLGCRRCGQPGRWDAAFTSTTVTEPSGVTSSRSGTWRRSVAPSGPVSSNGCAASPATAGSKSAVSVPQFLGTPPRRALSHEYVASDIQATWNLRKRIVTRTSTKPQNEGCITQVDDGGHPSFDS